MRWSTTGPGMLNSEERLSRSAVMCAPCDGQDSCRTPPSTRFLGSVRVYVALGTGQPGSTRDILPGGFVAESR
jgi:hypothetical protein